MAWVLFKTLYLLIESTFLFYKVVIKLVGHVGFSWGGGGLRPSHIFQR